MCKAAEEVHMKGRSLLIAGLLGVAIAAPASASGRLSGRITNGIGLPVPHSTVTWGALCPFGGTPGNTFSDANGYWSSPPLPNGKYSVGAGSAPCAMNVYLCGSDNTKT